MATTQIFSILAVIIGLTAATVEKQDCPMIPSCDTNTQYLYQCPELLQQKRCPQDPTLKNITGTDAGVCACDDGYYWKDDDTCVSMDDCCGINQVANHCFQVCPERCPHLRPPVGKIGVQCVTEIHSDKFYCNCKPGYLLDVHGECTNNCTKCGEHEWAVECPTPCPRTCFNLHDNHTVCQAMCLREGCICITGYVRDVDNKCILEDKCPVCTGKNEVYVKDPPPCPGTCSNPKGLPYCRKAQEKDGCVCKSGYVRNEDGVCVDLDSCPCEKES